MSAVGRLKAADAVGDYNELLKPVQDHLIKNWNLAISSYLESFMSHLIELSDMNFTEAALIVQNSTAAYCKRLEVVYKLVQEFTMEMRMSKEHGGDEGNKSGGSRRKKQNKSLEMEEMQLMDFVSAEHSLDAKMDKIVFSSAPKQVVLSAALKALPKAGTSVAVYQSPGILLGQKEEFRLFSRVYSDGTVNEDINVDDGLVLNVADESVACGDEVFEMVNRFEALRSQDQLHVENLLEAEQPSIDNGFDTHLPDVSMEADLNDLPPEPVMATKKTNKKRGKSYYSWEQVSIEIKITPKPLVVGNVLCIPKGFAETEDAEKVLQKMCAKRKRGQVVDKDGEEVPVTWINSLFRVGTFLDIQMKIESKNRKTARANARRPASPSSPVNHNDDVDNDVQQDEIRDFDDDFMDDNDLREATRVERIDEQLPVDADNFLDDALSALERFKQSRRDYASRATEVARKVSAWHESIKPILDAAEARSVFDVHEYGTRILDKFPENDVKTFRPFASVIGSQPQTEICRYFLSTLMLANTLNVEIQKSDPTPLAVDCVQLRLITKVRHHEEMDEAFRVTSEQ